VTYGLPPPTLDRTVEHFATPAKAVESWTLLAACSEYDDYELLDAMLFPGLSGTHPTSDARERTMRRMCGLCPVRRPCLEAGLDSEELHTTDGVWGGVTERERLETMGLPREQRLALLNALVAEKVAELLLEGETPA
jgi:hypothetical protein